jgi:methyltransferase-like protein/ubiquinone/menaquinone biosynthesis C-methylase UbiE
VVDVGEFIDVDRYADDDGARDSLRAAYDDAPYESYSHPLSAPGHLGAIASMFGLDVPEVTNARVLEIGCAAAGNLIPFAATYPHARTVGIDLSRVQISQGRRRVQALGLDNVELVHGDIARTDLAALGQFDFIICHGVYSWVSDEVQDAILAACRHMLAPTGVAYLSYNVYPGWKAKEIVRDAMLLSAANGASPEQKVREARGAVEFLQKVAQPDSVLAKALDDYQTLAAETGDYYLLHEELEAFNTPCYFRDMVDRAHAHGLAYLADAQPEYMFARNYGALVVDRLAPEFGDDQVLLEQHLDFVVNRSFRQTLLVHGERTSQIRHRLDRTRFGRLHVSAWVPPVVGDTRLDDSSQQYGDQDGRTFFAHDRGIKAALEALNDRWPWTLSRQQLVDAARARLAHAGVGEAADLDVQVDLLLEVLIVQGHARYRLEPVAPETPGPWVRLDEPARRMAELTREDAEAFVFNRWHEMMPLSPVDRHLLPLLDGSRDREALVEALMGVFRENLIQIDRDGEPLVDETEVRQVLAAEVDALPQDLAELRLLRVDDHAGA